jgi:hypothetical protein
MEGWKMNILLSVVLLTISLLLPNGPVQAQILDEDHMTCMRIRDTNPAKTAKVRVHIKQLNEVQECTVNTRAGLLCAPSAKCITDASGSVRCDDPILAGPIPVDFTCYKLKCPKVPTRSALLFDQFSGPNGRIVTIGPKNMLCTPTRKVLGTPAD